jgi:hypothetical protein
MIVSFSSNSSLSFYFSLIKAKENRALTYVKDYFCQTGEPGQRTAVENPMAFNSLTQNGVKDHFPGLTLLPAAHQQLMSSTVLQQLKNMNFLHENPSLHIFCVSCEGI